MPTHSAKSLFDQNIKSAKECLKLYRGVRALHTTLKITWVLRAGIVFVVSALDRYFHDKVKYRVGRYGLDELPPALARFEIPLSDLARWASAERPGNVLRNWVTDGLAKRPLQNREAIAEALKLAGITDLWPSVERDEVQRKKLLDDLAKLVKRRNQIAHEGDMATSRASGKRLRPISEEDLENAIAFVSDLIEKVEGAFPR